jgi:hypothetical protein
VAAVPLHVEPLGRGRCSRDCREPRSYARRFHVDRRRAEPQAFKARCGPAIRFLNLLFGAFRPEIEALQDAKAAALDDYRRGYPGVDPYEDRSLEILSAVAIDVCARSPDRPSCAEDVSLPAGARPIHAESRTGCPDADGDISGAVPQHSCPRSP